jgi:hypothetical protein
MREAALNGACVLRAPLKPRISEGEDGCWRDTAPADEPTPARHVSMTWAQRLKRVFKVDVETCEQCGGAVKVSASIEDPAVIKQILAHLERRDAPTLPAIRAIARASMPVALPGLKEPG